MKSFNGRTIVKRQKLANDTIKVGDRVLRLDTAFRKFWHTVQVAEVIETERKDIEPGDMIWVHHFIDEQGLPFGENLGYVEYNQVYCRKQGDKLETVGEFVLVEPITYGELGMTRTSSGLRLSTVNEGDNAERIGIVRLPSDKAIKGRLNDGDRVLFNKNCEYEILVDDKLYYRMELQDIICTVDPDQKIKV
jgi:co-chaperonin GroES (HSP10)